MNFLDIIFAAILLAFVAVGIKRGFIREVFRLAALLGGFAGALLGYPYAYPHLGFLSMSETGRTAVAFVVAFLAVAGTLLAIGWVARKVVHLTMLGWVDRLLGGGMGALKALILVWVAVLAMGILPGRGMSTVRAQSRAVSVLDRVPLSLDVPAMGGLSRYGTLVDSEPVRRLHEAKQSLDEFRGKVDSLKAIADQAVGGADTAGRIPQ